VSTEMKRSTSIGDRFRQARGPRSVRVMAEKIGCSPSTVSRIENGEVPDSVLMLSRLHETEGIDLNWLLAGDDANGGSR